MKPTRSPDCSSASESQPIRHSPRVVCGRDECRSEVGVPLSQVSPRKLGVGKDQRRGESPGANAERLASTPRRYRPIADPVLQGAWLGILNSLPLGASGAWTHEPGSRSNRRTTCVSEGFRHRTGLTRRRCCSQDVRRPPFLDWPSDVQQMIAEDDLITSTLLPAAPTASQ